MPPSISLCGVVMGEGSGRYGYEVWRAGGGIGAGFPSVSFCSTVSPDSYLLYKKRYSCVILDWRDSVHNRFGVSIHNLVVSLGKILNADCNSYYLVL